MADEPDLVRDGRDNDKDWVRFLQQTLEYWGYWSGEQDGEFTDELEEAVRSFQDVNGLIVDGWVGPKTWSVLNREAVVIDFDQFPLLKELAESNGDEEVIKQQLARRLDVESMDDLLASDSGEAYA